MDPDIEASLWNPEKARKQGFGNSWSVVWEAGPYEWAVNLSLGESAYASENQSRGEPEVDLMARSWLAEPYNSFILCFSF